MGGADVVNSSGMYGIQGVAAAGNIPGGREGAVTWTDAAGNFWLFGGIAAPSSTTDNYFNDLWKYSASVGQWIWVGGSNGYNQAGNYGTQGVASPSNIPGARFAAVSWKDATGNFWLFGGTGLDSTGSNQVLNDLWEYSPTTGEWTWIAGSRIAATNQSGIYGTQGMAAPGNIPGARQYAVSWTDASGNFWLFGGSGFDANGNEGNLSDVWKYSAGQWTWMAGSDVVNQPAIYGIQGTPSAGNTPGGRYGASSWTDVGGNFWLLGGASGQNTYIPLNDLWKYSAGQWTWIGGSATPRQSGVYGSRDVSSPGNTPGARASAVAWTNASGNLWLFGGDGFDSAGSLDELSDLWEYSGGQWMWVAGPNVAGRPGTYGILRTAASGNVPGGRSLNTEWTDTSGNFWIFGGYGRDANGALGYLNDLWRYEP